MLPADLIAALDTVAATPRLLVTSDFDGTLSPIVNNPADARALPAGSAALLDLAALPDTFVALVSGRALEVLRELSGMPDSVHLVGSHGAEFNTGFTQTVDTALLAEIAGGRSEVSARCRCRVVSIVTACRKSVFSTAANTG